MAFINRELSEFGVAAVYLRNPVSGAITIITIDYAGDSFAIGDRFLVSYTRGQKFLEVIRYLPNGDIDFRKEFELSGDVYVYRTVEVVGNFVILDGIDNSYLVNLLTEEVTASECLWKYNALQFVDINTVYCGITGLPLKEIVAEDHEGEIRWPECNLRWFAGVIADTLTNKKIAECSWEDANSVFVSGSMIMMPGAIDLSNFADKLDDKGHWIYVTNQTGTNFQPVPME